MIDKQDINMIRYNCLGPMHKAIRACLYETAILLQRADLSVQEDSVQAIEAVQEAIEVIEIHKQVYVSICKEIISLLEPTVTKELIGLNSQLNNLIEDLRRKLGAYREVNEQKLRRSKADDVITVYNEFIKLILSILNVQDNRTNHVLWKYFSDNEILLLKQQTVRDVNDRQLALQFKWMIRGNCNKDIIRWLLDIRNSCSANLLPTIQLIAEKELPVSRWDEIQTAIADGALHSVI